MFGRRDEIAARVRHRALSFATALATMLAIPNARTAPNDVQAQAKVLQTSDDFRFRVDACLKLGNSGDFRARKPLEGALDDAHPTVRQAAASALAKLGDVLAVPALEIRHGKEPNAPTKAAIANAITSLKNSAQAVPLGSGSNASAAPPNWSATKYVVIFNKVNNSTNVRGAALAAVLEGSARTKFATIQGVYVIPAGSAGTPLLAQATSKGVPVIGIDASVVTLDQAMFAGDVKIQAKVSFAISKLQVIKSSIEGNASSIGSASSTKNPQSLAKLQDMAVDGAVMSAMAKAPSAIAAAATK